MTDIGKFLTFSIYWVFLGDVISILSKCCLFSLFNLFLTQQYWKLWFLVLSPWSSQLLLVLIAAWVRRDNLWQPWAWNSMHIAQIHSALWGKNLWKDALRLKMPQHFMLNVLLVISSFKASILKRSFGGPWGSLVSLVLLDECLGLRGSGTWSWSWKHVDHAWIGEHWTWWE